MEAAIANMFAEAGANGSSTLTLGEQRDDKEPDLQCNSSDEESASESGEEEDEGDNEGIVSFSSFRNHSVGNPGNGGGNVTLFRMSVAKLPEVKSQL